MTDDREQRAGRTSLPTPSNPWRYYDDLEHPGRDVPRQRQVHATDNPVIHTLLGPKGETIRQWTERPPVGYRRDRSDPS